MSPNFSHIFEVSLLCNRSFQKGIHGMILYHSVGRMSLETAVHYRYIPYFRSALYSRPIVCSGRSLTTLRTCNRLCLFWLISNNSPEPISTNIQFPCGIGTGEQITNLLPQSHVSPDYRSPQQAAPPAGS